MSPRILLVSEIFPPKVGGSGRWFREIYPRLDGFDVTIAAGTDPDEGTVPAIEGVTVRRLPLTFPTRFVRPSSWPFYRRAERTLSRWIDEARPDQIHAGRAVPEGLIARRLWKRSGIPYTVYAHGEEVNLSNDEWTPTRWQRSVYQSRELGWLTSRVLGDAARIVANSENTRSLLIERWGLPEERVALLHPGVDLERFHPAERDPRARAPLGWGQRPVILTVGRLQRRKGQDMLIRALPAVLERHPRVLYAICGEGEERAALEALARDTGVDRHVVFHGEVDDETLVSCYQQCDLFALPNRDVGSDVEGFGMVLLEAQACGRPVLAGRSGGTRETFEDGVTGWLADCHDPSDLSVALPGILADRDRLDRMGRDARAFVERRFGWEALAARAAEIFG